MIFRPAVKLLCISLIFISTHLCAADPVIFAASSVHKAMLEVLDVYQRQTQTHVISSYASSSSLARQISQGAPADLYISANLKWMNYLKERDLLEESTHQPFLSNQLVLISHRSADQKHSAFTGNLFENLSKSQRLSVGNPNHVPLGHYAKEALQHYDLWEQVKSFLAPTHSARSALSLVEKEETPLGISYLTDAKSSSQVKIVSTFPKESHSPILYPSAIVKNRKTENNMALYNFLFSKTAADIFRKNGFTLVDRSGKSDP